MQFSKNLELETFFLAFFLFIFICMYLYPVITIYSNIVYVKLDIKSQLFRSELVYHVVFLEVYNTCILI